ncbi:hypothetical protein [Anaerotignum sp.]|uniref:hypothetical protein n=1 Tax=Anaerotignum sp. TaxID=2039241 RepID=UPI00289C998C|nr:hypothetical protein [Anaerotignum sp.]
MYPYHNKIKQRIKNGELKTYFYSNSYPKIGECLVLVFKTEPNYRPIRPYRYHEYLDLLETETKLNAGKQKS